MQDNEVVHNTSSPLKSMEEILESLPIGIFHYRLLLMCGLAFMADAMEVSLLSFLSTCAGLEWDLSTNQMATITSAVFAGEMIGAFFWGPFADFFGRRKGFIMACCFITSAGFLSGLSPNVSVLIPLRFLVGFGVGGLSVPFDLLAEFLPSSSRGKFLLYIEFFWTLGSLFVTGIAWAVLSTYGWRVLAYFTAIPVTIACIATIIYLPESPRWLLEKGRSEEAEKVIQTAASVNKSTLEPFRLSELHLLSNNGLKTDLWDLVGPYLRWISFPLWIVWFAFGFSYYGVILFVARLFTTTSSSTECSFDYQSIFLNSIAEILGVAITVGFIDKFGRSRSQAILYLLAGVTALCMGLSFPFVLLSIVSGLGRMFAMGASSVTWVATSELYPTRVRATGHSICSALARLGAFMSPYIVQGDLSIASVGAVLLTVNIIAATASMMLPETVGKGLDQVGHSDSFSLSPLSQLISLLTTGSLQASGHSTDPLMNPPRKGGGFDTENRMDMSPLVTIDKGGAERGDSERGSSNSSCSDASTPLN